jgi:pimeloyl-ACP methyl ester carboxylesterase
MRAPAAPSHTRRMTTIRVNDVSLYYEEHGSGEPILCVHGTGSSTVLWRRPATELAKHGRTIVYDRRGFGISERPEPFVTDVHQHADDAAALIEALRLTPAIVIGRSQGGEIAVDLALRYPDRVRALALLEGGGMSLSEEFDRWRSELLRSVFAAAAKDVGSVGETMFRIVLGDAGWEALPDEVQRVFVANSPAILAEERGAQLEVIPAELGSIAKPVLLVGARDSGPAFAEVTELTARAMPSARVEWVDGTHLIDAAHPVVLAFVDEVLAGREARSTAPV